MEKGNLIAAACVEDPSAAPHRVLTSIFKMHNTGALFVGKGNDHKRLDAHTLAGLDFTQTKRLA